MMGYDPKRGGKDEYMGSSKPLTKITLPSYYIAETQVTQSLWQAVMDSDPISLHNKGVMNTLWIIELEWCCG